MNSSKVFTAGSRMARLCTRRAAQRLSGCQGRPRLAAEVSVLFDPTNLPSRLCPRPAVLKELVQSINGADLIDAWKPGNEETLGWLYQAFNAQELQDAFAAARESKKKFEAADIPAV